jgi:hypothetical protein
MWSKQLQEISREYFEIDGTHCKSTNGNFGVLSIDYQNKIYTISLKPEFTENLTFHSIDDMIKSGWSVD